MAMRITGPSNLPPRQNAPRVVVAAPAQPVVTRPAVMPPAGPDPLAWLGAKLAAFGAWIMHFFKPQAPACEPPKVVPPDQDDPSPGAVDPDPVGGDDPVDPQPVVSEPTPEPVVSEPAPEPVVTPEPVVNEPVVNEPAPVMEPVPLGKKCQIYRVVSGDTLRDIAAEKLGDEMRWPEIYNMNRRTIGSNPDLIYPGQVLRLPAA